MLKFILLSLVLFGSLILGNVAYSQIKITGKTIDLNTSLPVASVSLIMENKLLGISNELGEFEIDVKTLPSKIIFRHVSYILKEVELNGNGDVRLENSIITLPDLVTEFSAEKIINNVIKKSLQDTLQRDLFYAHFQNISKAKGEIGKFHEMYVNVSWGQLGIDKWEPIQVRYGQKSNSFFTGPNSRVMAFVRSSILYKKDNMPLNVNYLNADIYKLKIDGYLNIGKENEIVIIDCKTKKIEKEEGVGYFNGKIYINKKTDNLLKMQGEIANKKDKRGITRSHTIDVNFIENARGFSEFSHLELNETFDSRRLGDKTTSRMSLSIINKVAGFQSEKVLGFYSKDDLIALKTISYNKAFWENTAPKKLTKIEKDALIFLEKEMLMKGN